MSGSSTYPGPRSVPAPVPWAARPPAPSSVTLTLTGELDTRGAERLRALLDDAVAPGRRLVLDLSGVEHLSSAALAVLVAGHRRLRDAGGALVVSSPSSAVVRVLRVSGLHRVIVVDVPSEVASVPLPAAPLAHL